MSMKDRIGWAVLQQTLIIYWCIQDLWGPVNLVDLMVAELDNTPPYFTGDIGIYSVRVIHGCSVRYRVEDLH
jgi:hypothetical protein